MMSWDPHGAERLEEIKRAVADVSLDVLVQEAVKEVWSANRARHEPEELFDDAFTLSTVSSRNLANRLYTTVNRDSGLRRAGVSATRDFAATVLRVGAFDIRLVKTPHLAARKPDFVSSFDWRDSESRLAAAARNHGAYSPPIRRPEMSPLFEIEQIDASESVRGCRDAFLVWGAEYESELTAGWLGLPTTTPDRWLAVAPLWWDEPASRTTKFEDADASTENVGFADQPEPVPNISLKVRKIEGNSL
ncbi:hypothetical protein JD276_08245 [Leucobacter sp. CSA1]|uniref:Uncharacterized protein n=1 Tax=Leucobacter chromiisoli TaxID=2796471 RepID=A0A934Q666_9MICO|nr:MULTISPECIES: hypothetical protein [Microbacteriaceae]MBK0419024.1 hypothetical protein [Leucobacter chromiisoli]MCD1569894.1 hypothetical protein [Agromyces mediolanus]